MLTYNIFNDLFNVQDTPVSRSRNEFPYIKIYEGNDEIHITAVIPGVKSEDLEINLVDNKLIIEGEKKNTSGEKKCIRNERDFGNFKRSVKLPYRVDVNRINAELKDGILHVNLYKSEDAKPKKIEIK